MDSNIIEFRQAPAIPAMVLDERAEQHWLQENCFVIRATADYVSAQVAGSLTLVCPVGMTEDDRIQWIATAAGSIIAENISPNDLRKAVQAARVDPLCDHHSKIVPSIIRALGPNWKPYVQEMFVAKHDDPRGNFQIMEDRVKARQITEAELNALPERWLQILDCRLLARRHDDGVYRLRPPPISRCEGMGG